MAYRENCLNCHHSHFTKALTSLEYVDFSFGGQQISLLGYFEEAPVTRTYGPKICRDCLEVLRTCHVASKKKVLQGTNQQKKTQHICTTCLQHTPANNTLSVRLTVVNANGRQVNLEECLKAIRRKCLATVGHLTMCLSCVSTVVEDYTKLPEFWNIDLAVVKTEPDSFNFESELPVPVNLPENLDTLPEPTTELIKTEPVKDIELIELPTVVKTEPDEPPEKNPESEVSSKQQEVKPEPTVEPEEIVVSPDEPYELLLVTPESSLANSGAMPESFKNESGEIYELLEVVESTEDDGIEGRTSQNRFLRYKCPQCHLDFRSSSGLKKHIASKKRRAELDQSQTFKCFHCSKNCKSRAHLKHHFNNGKCKMANALKCSKCDMTFDKPYQTGMHERTAHRLECKICGRNYANQTYLDIHLEKHQPEKVANKPKPLTLVQKTFTGSFEERVLQSQLAMAARGRKHQPGEFKCEVAGCGKVLQTQYTLQLHQKRHEMDRKKLNKSK